MRSDAVCFPMNAAHQTGRSALDDPRRSLVERHRYQLDPFEDEEHPFREQRRACRSLSRWLVSQFRKCGSSGTPDSLTLKGALDLGFVPDIADNDLDALLLELLHEWSLVLDSALGREDGDSVERVARARYGASDGLADGARGPNDEDRGEFAGHGQCISRSVSVMCRQESKRGLYGDFGNGVRDTRDCGTRRRGARR